MAPNSERRLAEDTEVAAAAPRQRKEDKVQLDLPDKAAVHGAGVEGVEVAKGRYNSVVEEVEWECRWCQKVRR